MSNYINHLLVLFLIIVIILFTYNSIHLESSNQFEYLKSL